MLIGNASAAEHLSSVTFAVKNKMNLSVGIALSSSLQIGLLVTPALVLVGWAIDQPMTLYFENFETVVLFASVLIVNYLIQDARSNWLEGALLLVRKKHTIQTKACMANSRSSRRMRSSRSPSTSTPRPKNKRAHPSYVCTDRCNKYTILFGCRQASRHNVKITMGTLCAVDQDAPFGFMCVLFFVWSGLLAKRVMPNLNERLNVREVKTLDLLCELKHLVEIVLECRLSSGTRRHVELSQLKQTLELRVADLIGLRHGFKQTADGPGRFERLSSHPMS